jgi:GNAT superfamily N-acetyltransferase
VQSPESSPNRTEVTGTADSADAAAHGHASVQVEQVLPGVTVPLRQKVLRPHQSFAQMHQAGDEDAETAFFAAYDADHRVVGAGSVRRETSPWGEPGWRLRGMATEPELRGRGIGAAVLARVIDHVGRLGGGLLWCNARIPAQRFYEREGFVTRGESWIDPDIGPHIVMRRLVDAI